MFYRFQHWITTIHPRTPGYSPPWHKLWCVCWPASIASKQMSCCCHHILWHANFGPERPWTRQLGSERPKEIRWVRCVTVVCCWVQHPPFVILKPILKVKLLLQKKQTSSEKNENQSGSKCSTSSLTTLVPKKKVLLPETRTESNSSGWQNGKIRRSLWWKIDAASVKRATSFWPWRHPYR